MTLRIAGELQIAAKKRGIRDTPRYAISVEAH